MDSPNTILVYTDYKSPYAFLAKDLIYELEDQFDVNLEWLPYTLDIPSYLGSARLDERGDVIKSSRNAHQWRRVRYSYMDCRRQARKRGLVVLGTRKIWDSSLAAVRAGINYKFYWGPSATAVGHTRVPPSARRFPPPWTVDKTKAWFMVRIRNPLLTKAAQRTAGGHRHRETSMSIESLTYAELGDRLVARRPHGRSHAA